MAAQLNLQPNEGIIERFDGYQLDFVKRSKRQQGEIVLTNLNFFWVRKGMLGGIKESHQYPLQQVKVLEGKAQVRLDDDDVVEVYLIDAQLAFEFDSRSNAAKFANGINRVVTGNAEPIVTAALPGVEAVATALKDTFDAFGKGFGLKKEETITAQCVACGASIAGHKGQVVSCQYCGNKQKL